MTTLPAEWPVVEVRVGPYFGTDGRPLEGERVSFEPRAKRILLEDETTIVRRITSVTLDNEGRGTVELPVSDDPDLSVTGWTWQVRERFRWGQTFDIDVLTEDVAAGIDLADRAPVAPDEPRYPQALAAQVSGFQEHGNVSGDVTFSGPTASHRFDATGPTTITLDDYSEGQVATLICFSGADDVTVNDAGDAVLVDGTAWTAELARDVWVSGGGGGGAGEPVTPDTTPPTAVTDLTATGGEAQLTYSWTAATDAESSVKYGVKVWEDSDTEPSTYTIRTSGGPVTVTGLEAGTYNVELYAFSTGGSTTPDTATATVTAPLPDDVTDTFTAADTSTISGRTTVTGGKTWVTPWTTGLGDNTIAIASNKATASSGGAAASFSAGSQNYRISGAYAAPVGTQVRLYARSSATNALSSDTSSINVAVKGDGSIAVDYGTNANAVVIAGSGQPLTGTLALEVNGTAGRVLVNGTQVGSSFTIPSGITGPHTGFACYQAGATLDDFKVEYL